MEAVKPCGGGNKVYKNPRGRLRRFNFEMPGGQKTSYLLRNGIPAREGSEVPTYVPYPFS